jgi:hypothetical protein
MYHSDSVGGISTETLTRLLAGVDEAGASSAGTSESSLSRVPERIPPVCMRDRTTKTNSWTDCVSLFHPLAFSPQKVLDTEGPSS